MCDAMRLGYRIRRESSMFSRGTPERRGDMHDFLRMEVSAFHGSFLFEQGGCGLATLPYIMINNNQFYGVVMPNGETPL
jgi:hypothetical protein